MGMMLEKYLVLNKYFLSLFGFTSFDELRGKLKDTPKGRDSVGRSFYISELIASMPGWEPRLLEYDNSIKSYVERLKLNRRKPDFELTYFQYMAVLFTEIFLEKYYTDRESLLRELNEFLKRYNSENGLKIGEFTAENLKKLAFWMATGSGKTLVMHINYWQILKYSKRVWDNLILITPNEDMSKQHYKEFRLSGIPCRLYNGNAATLKTGEGEVLIIDIHKLTEEKSGGGVSVDVSYFDGKNLVFIDEGHKGQSSEELKWKKLREEIGKNGFVFEYSATFGQVVGKNRQLVDEYSRAIIFDYSYRYFYIDGYGKDFYVYNIKPRKIIKGAFKSSRKLSVQYTAQQVQLLLTAGLLAYYEQLLIYRQYGAELKEYEVEKPLWIFVGSKVSGAGLNSDIVNVISFLQEILSRPERLKNNVSRVLNGDELLRDENGRDIFKELFGYLRGHKTDVNVLVQDIYNVVFHGAGTLQLFKLENARGEIGLRVSTSGQYFGVINVGDVNALIKVLKKRNINVETDSIRDSLFSAINMKNSPVHLLIGSKKFVEGWDSWRVSTMGLLNIGKSEGPQIIQLFGRGVRLKGKNYSLKRESSSDYRLKALQTLYIFGLNSDYMSTFLNIISREGVEYDALKYSNPRPFEAHSKGNIYTSKHDCFDFQDKTLHLEYDEAIAEQIKLDFRPVVKVWHGMDSQSVIAEQGRVQIPDDVLDMLDWDFLYAELMNFKTHMRYYNLILEAGVLKKVVNERRYSINLAYGRGVKIKTAHGAKILQIETFDGVWRVNEIILLVLKEYISRFYRARMRGTDD